MTHFLLVFDRATSSVLERHEFADADLGAARHRRHELVSAFLGRTDIEVVLLSSRSEDDLKRTHGRYFEGRLDPTV